MNANDLLKKIIASGADEEGIRDRFGDNVDLYESCFREFTEEPSFIALYDAMKAGNHEQAFESAHALKGLSGNLGITDFYNAIRKLTESLRHGEYNNLDEEYAEVERQHEKLKRIASDQPEPEDPPPEPSPITGKFACFTPLRSFVKDKNNRLFLWLLCSSVVVVSLIGLLFCRINIVHRNNVTDESGRHLTEIINQIKLYIEDNIDIDWRIAQSVGDSILGSAYVDDDPAVFDMLQKKRAVWGVSDLMLYTENGYCIYADGSTEVTDIASKTVYHARESGKCLSIVDSSLIFTVPLDTVLTFQGSEIVAISVVRDVSSFLDDMNFSSFGGTAWMYLTDKNGVVISSLSGPFTTQAFNIDAIIDGADITSLNKAGAPQDFLTCVDTGVFTLSDNSGKNYGVSTPIMTEAEPMRLFYFVPENEVNSIMSGFSQQLTILSILVITIFAAVGFTVFIYLYKSRKKMFDRAILNREKMFDLLVRNTRTAFGRFTVNRLRPEYLSANATEVTGDSYWALYKTDSGYQIQNDRHEETENIILINEALREWDGKHTFRSGYLCNNRNATPTYFVFELYPTDNGAGDFVGIAQDVTSIYAREEATKVAMESARQANDAKTRFLSSMSHDIRTPMNAIINMSNFALENLDRPKNLGNYLHVIHESADHLLHLINDVLDMNRIESGRLLVASAPLDIKEEIKRQIEVIRPMCIAKNQTLMTDFSGLGEAVVLGDALKLSQIIINLLSNAMKFTPEKGAVRLTVQEMPSLRPDIMIVRFIVEDNGIGISEEDIRHIFEPFNRANDEAISSIEGTGLGLAIVKNYVDAMGGSIHCESEVGEGSTFTVELFFRKADSLIDRSNKHSSLTNDSFLGIHALVAEDNPTNRMIAKELLERMGFMLDFVNDGAAAVRQFLNSKPNTYDVIYMDIQMPVMDGLTAAVQIRACNHPQAKTIPIIAMTANAFEEDIEKARVAGMDGYVAKPIVSFELAEQTDKALKNKKGETK